LECAGAPALSHALTQERLIKIKVQPFELIVLPQIKSGAAAPHSKLAAIAISDTLCAFGLRSESPRLAD